MRPTKLNSHEPSFTQEDGVISGWSSHRNASTRALREGSSLCSGESGRGTEVTHGRRLSTGDALRHGRVYRGSWGARSRGRRDEPGEERCLWRESWLWPAQRGAPVATIHEKGRELLFQKSL
jgi:hypothetical protein